MGAETRDAPGTMRRDLVTLVDEALLPQAFEHPPRRLDVAVVAGDVCRVHVQPHPGPLGHRLPLLDVAEDALAAAPVELFDAQAFDLRFRGEAQLLLDLELDRQPVRVPAAAAQRPEPAHRLVAQDHVLEGPREDVVDPGAAVRGRRPLVEHEQRRRRADAVNLAERVLVAPSLKDCLLELGKPHSAGDGSELPLRLLGHLPTSRPTTKPVHKRGRAYMTRGTTTVPFR